LLSGSDECPVRVSQLSLTYQSTVEKVPTLKTRLRRLGLPGREVTRVEALRDVSLEVSHGSVLGVIGLNGAGKSTLLRTIAGILPPTQGRIEVRGRVSTLLELGVGFNGNLSGRENVILGGLAQGWSEEQLWQRYHQIAEFAGIGEFIDMPMKSYSAGMYQRLAFSVGVHMDADILLVDEALSAGDAEFKTKARARMEQVIGSARTVVMVSHALASIRELATDCLWLHKGRVAGCGQPRQVIDDYLRFLELDETAFAHEDV
jgi:ABC-type polysaccharide/polyol phosphate transport system ATPase subunit